MKMGSHQVLFMFAIFSVAILEFAHGGSNVSITLLQSAVAKGAVCLDGTAPGYAYQRGYGDGADRWIVYLRGGGWCITRPYCYNTSLGRLGSSTGFLEYYQNELAFQGMLDDNATINPDFYNWNKVQILYCDGSSFLSDKAEVDPVYNISYRGGRIYDAMMEELILNMGMTKATDAILAGGSAGGLAAILHCDKFGALFNSNATKVKCLSDSGFFIHGMDFIGADLREAQWFNLIQTHGLTDLLPSSCTTKFSPTLCLFPENLIPNIQTPLFLIESAFDSYQLGYTLFNRSVNAHWVNCTNGLMICNWTEVQIMKEFRNNFIMTLKNTIKPSSSIGYIVDSCFHHGHIQGVESWTHSHVVKDNVLINKTTGQAFSDWYFEDQTIFQEIDMSNDLPLNCTQS